MFFLVGFHGALNWTHSMAWVIWGLCPSWFLDLALGSSGSPVSLQLPLGQVLMSWLSALAPRAASDSQLDLGLPCMLLAGEVVGLYRTKDFKPLHANVLCLISLLGFPHKRNLNPSPSISRFKIPRESSSVSLTRSLWPPLSFSPGATTSYWDERSYAILG